MFSLGGGGGNPSLEPLCPPDWPGRKGRRAESGAIGRPVILPGVQARDTTHFPGLPTYQPGSPALEIWLPEHTKHWSGSTPPPPPAQDRGSFWPQVCLETHSGLAFPATSSCPQVLIPALPLLQPCRAPWGAAATPSRSCLLRTQPCSSITPRLTSSGCCQQPEVGTPAPSRPEPLPEVVTGRAWRPESATAKG